MSPSAKARADVAALHVKLHGRLRRLEEEKSIHVEHRDIKKVKALKSAAADKRRRLRLLAPPALSVPQRRKKTSRAQHPGAVAPVIVVHGKEQVKDV